MAKSAKGKGSAKQSGKTVEALSHKESKRRNIPTAEYQALHGKGEEQLQTAYERRNRDLDPQLVWRGKDEQDWSDLVVTAPPLYIQEKVHPKALIDDLLRQTREQKHDSGEIAADLFADFNGMPKGVDKTEFYQHDQNWSNRMILGDSLQVMASLAEREGLRGKVQCIYFDPPYGIKFNSNFQWSTTSRDVKDGNAAHITREPEQVKAFRDTWRDGIHSYLTYLRDRLTVARDLLTESGSIFVQIGDENIHRVRALMDEVFGDTNAIVTIYFRKTTTQSGDFLADTNDYILWYARHRESAKFRALQHAREGFDWVNYDYVMSSDLRSRRLTRDEKAGSVQLTDKERVYRRSPLTSASSSTTTLVPFPHEDAVYRPGKGGWKTGIDGLVRLAKSLRIETYGSTASFRRYTSDFPYFPISNSWTDTASGGYGDDKTYVVQTNAKVIERCVLMASDPGDIVLDPTCGSGTSAAVAEQWGRRWITIDTSRVALALARARIMGARYPFYLLADSRDGQIKEAEVTRTTPSSQPAHDNIRHGFVYERVPHITLKSIVNNSEIDVIWENWQGKLEPLRERLNAAINQSLQEWEIPRDTDSKWSVAAKKVHTEWWQARIARQQEIDKSIAAKAEFEYLCDRPYEDNRKVRVAGPFTVESLSPHRVLGVDENDELIDTVMERKTGYVVKPDFPTLILENLRAAGVQQADKGGRIAFTALVAWPGDLVCADARYMEGNTERRAAIFIGPEFGTVTRPDLVAAAREATESGFDVLIACAFNFEAHTTEFGKLGKVPVLKARMNADLHMADDLKKTDKANLFVIFGEPDIEIIPAEQGRLRVKVKGVDVFDPSTGEVRSNDTDGIACWFIDTDYNEESFFVRHAYFLGANDPYKTLKTTLKAEINQEAWESLYSDTSRAFERPRSGRIAVKVINHLGDEVMKVFRV
jgi:adenine-specific DNA-methyltransferase